MRSNVFPQITQKLYTILFFLSWKYYYAINQQFIQTIFFGSKKQKQKYAAVKQANRLKRSKKKSKCL